MRAAHGLPLVRPVRSRQRVELVAQPGPAVPVEHSAVGGGAAVEGDLLAGAGHRAGHLLLGVPGRDHRQHADLDVGRRPSRRGQTGGKRRERHLAQVALGGERVHQQAVGDLPGHRGHGLPDRGEEDPGRAARRGRRREERGHQRVGVEVTAEAQFGPVVPRRPDRPHGHDELPHARGGMAPGHREPPLDVRLYLAAQAEDEPPVRIGLQVMRGVGELHGGAGKGHRDGRAERHLPGVLGRQHQGQEGVMRGLRRPQPVVARLLVPPGLVDHRGGGPRPELAVDLHRFLQDLGQSARKLGV